MAAINAWVVPYQVGGIALIRHVTLVLLLTYTTRLLAHVSALSRLVTWTQTNCASPVPL
jgi:hypothetical protein